MPLIDSEFLPIEGETAAGAVDDARPDRWGERVIRFLEKPPRLSVMAGIRVAETRPIALQTGHALAVKRFDRVAGRRIHAVSAKVALKAAGEKMGYPELAQILRRRGRHWATSRCALAFKRLTPPWRTLCPSIACLG